MIVVHHTHEYFGYGGWLARALPLDQGVSFFFVLSGFILFYTNGAISSLGDAGRFLAARVARIWPLQAGTLFLTVLFVPQPWGPAGPALEPAFASERGLISASLAWRPFVLLGGISFALYMCHQCCSARSLRAARSARSADLPGSVERPAPPSAPQFVVRRRAAQKSGQRGLMAVGTSE